MIKDTFGNIYNTEQQRVAYSTAKIVFSIALASNDNAARALIRECTIHGSHRVHKKLDGYLDKTRAQRIESALVVHSHD